MFYEHPLAYLLGFEGVALLRAFTGEFDRQFVEARLAEVRELPDDESLNGQCHLRQLLPAQEEPGRRLVRRP